MQYTTIVLTNQILWSNNMRKQTSRIMVLYLYIRIFIQNDEGVLIVLTPPLGQEGQRRFFKLAQDDAQLFS